MIHIVHYGMGNVGSIANMLKKLGCASIITSDPEELKAARKLILPGVGAFDAAMDRINRLGLFNILTRKAREERVPLLGICLGMQLLTESSEEGEFRGLGFVPARTLAFRGRIPSQLKVPHMGWNVAFKGIPSYLTEGFDDGGETRFYFVHSYFVQCVDRAHSVLTTTYGLTYDCAFQRENIFGVQFHPEKSHRFGMRLLANFVNLKC